MCTDRFRIIISFGSDITGIDHVVHGSQFYANTLSHIAFHHAADPAANTGLLAKAVDLKRMREASYPGGLDIHKAAGADLQRLTNHKGVRNAFVKTDRSVDHFLQLSVIKNVHRAERLLDHGQSKVIQLAENVSLIDGIRRIAVDMECTVGESGSDGLYHVHIPAVHCFEFYPFCTAVQSGSHFRDQVIQTVCNAKAGSLIYCGYGAFRTKKLMQRQPFHISFQRPPGDLNAGFCKGIAFDAAHGCQQFLRGVKVLPQNHGS